MPLFLIGSEFVPEKNASWLLISASAGPGITFQHQWLAREHAIAESVLSAVGQCRVFSHRLPAGQMALDASESFLQAPNASA